METKIDIAWRVPKTQDFDLKEFAVSALEIAKENLQTDRELTGVAFVVTNDEIQCASLSFADHDEKVMRYKKLVEYARAEGALAIVTCNDAFMSNHADPAEVEGYYPGKLEAEGASECIMVTVSGPGVQTWSVELPYERNGDQIRFGEVSEEFGSELGLLEGWASDEPKVH